MVTQTLSRSGVKYTPTKAARQEISMHWNFITTDQLNLTDVVNIHQPGVLGRLNVPRAASLRPHSDRLLIAGLKVTNVILV